MLKKLILRGAFKGGVHPREGKELTKDLQFEVLPTPKTVYIPLSQHAGREAKLLVAKGSIVKKGTLLAEPEGFISAPIHSSVNGTVSKIVKTAHLSGAPKTVIEISVTQPKEPVAEAAGPQKVSATVAATVTPGVSTATEAASVQKVNATVAATVTPGGNTTAEPADATEVAEEPQEKKVAEPENEFFPPLNPKTATKEELLERIKEAGIVGMGGAAFPMFVKLSPPPGKKIEKLIINAAECEPYLTRDYRLILEYTDQLIGGIEILMKITGVECVIGIEDNKPEAIVLLKNKLGSRSDIRVEVLPVKYPQGAEKMLIYAITGKKVPPGKLPVDVGVVMQNVGTAISVWKAVTEGTPQTDAWITVTGEGIKTPKNLIVPVGTPISEILEFCGGLTPEAIKVIAGGPMMGTNLYDYNAPVMKATSGLLVLTSDTSAPVEAIACLRCGKCVEVCPVNLLPTRLSRFSKLQRFEAYECPAGIPLVQWIRLGKKELLKIKAQERKSA